MTDVPPRTFESLEKELAADQPLFELYEMMHSISESHMASSWPGGYEWKIWKWVDAGDPAAPPPFDDRHRVATPEFFSRLRELRELCGGWLYFESERGVVFADAPEWERIRVEQEQFANKIHKEFAELPAKMARMNARFLEIIELAKSDSDFWQALRNWELVREAKRPANALEISGGVAGPVRIVKGGTIVRLKESLNDIPLDPLFHTFLQRAYQPDDEMSARYIVLSLRAMVREELGLDGALQWPGGPTLGVS